MTTPVSALLVDDEPDILELLALTLERMNIVSHTASTLKGALDNLKKNSYQLCLTDMRLPDGDGIELVRHVQKNRPNMPIAVITAYGSLEAAIQALKAGAFDFVSKPIELTGLRTLVEKALVLTKIDTQVKFPQFVGHSPALRQLEQQIYKLARSQAPVHISGESGTGKELVARMIHYQGPRRNGPFIPINCGAIPSELMESEFFGHKKGSFTGAVEDKQGLFQAAQGGTLFLDEVADLPLAMQVKLLRVIQEKQVRPIGEQKEIATDVRILSATHKNLQQLVNEGLFRQDLFYRVNVIELAVPPLRQRTEDIEPLSIHFLQRLAKDLNLPSPQLSSAALKALQHYSFPGNVRELENILERALTLCETDTIQEEHLHLQRAQALSETPDEPFSRGSLETYLAHIEKKIILNSLEDNRWNRTVTAKKLGMTFRSLRYRLKKLGIDETDEL